MVYELFDHTADLGLRVRAPTLEQLYADAGAGLFAMIVEEPLRQTTCERRIRLAGEREDDLLFDWLSELLYLFEHEQLLCSRFKVRRTRQGIEALVAGEPVDPDRHRLLHEVKAITYHGLRVEEVDDGWLAEVIVDI